MSHELDAFLLGLFPGATTKTSGLDAFTASDLGLLYGTPASHLEAAEKFAHDSACFLEQFEGTPLHGKAIALVGEELQIEAERIQRDEARRAQAEPVDDSWSKQRMIDLKKRQLELELHKMKAQHEGAEGREQEAQERAEGAPAPQTTGAVPAKTAALKLAVSRWWIGDRVQGFAEGIRRSNVDDRLRRAALKTRVNAQLAGELRSAGLSAGSERARDRLLNAARKRDDLASSLRNVPHWGKAEEVIADRAALEKARAAKARALIPPNPAPQLGKNLRGKTAGTPADVARGLLTGGKKEAWRSAAQYMSPADLLAKAQQSGKAQSGGISRSVSDYLTKKASLGARVVAAAQRGAQQAATGMASRAAFPAVAKAPPTAPNAASFLAKKSPYMLKVPGSR